MSNWVFDFWNILESEIQIIPFNIWNIFENETLRIELIFGTFWKMNLTNRLIYFWNNVETETKRIETLFGTLLKMKLWKITLIKINHEMKHIMIIN